MDRLVDEGDLGDTYNFSPDPTSESEPNATTGETPTNVEVRMLERGPARGRIRIIRTYRSGSESSMTVRTSLGGA